MAETTESLNRYVARSTFRQQLMTGLVDDAVSEYPRLLIQHPHLVDPMGRFVSGLEALGENYGRGCEEVYEDLDELSLGFFGDENTASEGTLATEGLSMVVIVPQGLTVIERIVSNETQQEDIRVQFSGATRYGGYAYSISGIAPGGSPAHSLITEGGLLIQLCAIGEGIVRPYIIRCQEAARIILARRELAECFDHDPIKAFKVNPSRHKVRDGYCGSCTRDNCRCK